MDKKRLTTNDIGDSGYKILSTLASWDTLYGWMMVSDIVMETGLSETTVRRVIQKLETLGLLRWNWQHPEDLPYIQCKHFDITEEGRTLLKYNIIHV
jgi:DNA-binding MarR family transcriptional regulator